METDGVEPITLELLQAIPNPFTSVTTITYVLRRPSAVKITILDVSGGVVQLLDAGEKRAGTHRLRFEAGELGAGIYFCRLEAGELAVVRSLVLAK